MQRISHFPSVISSGLFALAFFTSFAIAQQSDTTTSVTPTSLSITPIDEKAALIKAKLPQEKPGGEASVTIGDKVLVLSDNGKGGDEKPGDGIFSIKTEFDFEAFAKANLQLADAYNGEARALFSAGGRQHIGTRRIIAKGEHLLFADQTGRVEQQFQLPLTRDLFRVDHNIDLPLLGQPLGVPTGGGAHRAASIPHSLMITDLDVVNDPTRTWACRSPNQPPVGNPTGEWTYWRLMENIANGTASTSDYIKRFFDHWNSVQLINNQNVLARPLVYQQIIREWEIRSGGVGAPLLPEESPFRLLGIVLRLDLRGEGGVYGGGEAGEGRFVFSLHDGNCNNKSKTLILEYKVPIAGCTNVRDWAKKWVDLAGSANYNDDLAQLTDAFTAAGANPAAPNQSAIGQIRTNELLPGSPGWELREFVLPRAGGWMEQTTVKQEPQIQHNNSSLLANFVNTEWPSLIGPPPAQHEITSLYNSINFLAGAAPAAVLWNVPNSMLTVPTTPSPNTPPPATVRDDALFELALNTCSGCHVIETGTPFAHLDYNTPVGQPALLSGFLTGITLPDPRNPAIPRTFNDLARRAIDLDNAANMSCAIDGDIAVGNLVLERLTTPPRVHAVH